MPFGSEGVRYIKVAKIDKDGVDQTNSLQSLTELTIPYSSGAIIYNILNITEHPTNFIYYVENPNIEWTDRADIYYSFSGSYTGSPLPFYATPPITSSLDNQNYFLEGGSSSGLSGDSYRILTYPQKSLNIRISSSVQFSVTAKAASTTSVTASVRILSSPLIPNSIPPNPTVLATTVLSQSLQNLASTPFNFTGSYDLSTIVSSSQSSPGDCIYFEIKPAVDGGAPGNGCSITGPKFTNGIFNISSSQPSGPSIGTIPEPYFEGNFARSLDCQPTLNNVILNRKGNLYQDVDYNSGVSSPTNYTLILNNTALKAEIPDSNYTLTRSTRPRYEGTKNTSQKLNTWTKNGSWGSNEGTYGKEPSISLEVPLIYEFEWGGGTTPEILGWGSFKMGKILNVQTSDSVRDVDPSEGLKTQQQFFPFPASLGLTSLYRRKLYNGSLVNAGIFPNNATGSAITGSGVGDNVHFWSISQSVSDYYYSLNNNLPINTEISITQYNPNTAGLNPTSPQTSKILTTKFGVPFISNYALTSSNSYNYGALGNTGGYGFLTLTSSAARPISRVIRDSNGNYISGEPIRASYNTIGDEIVESLNNNEKWFITVYNEFEFVGTNGTYDNALTSGSLSPMNNGYSTLDENGNYPDPLTYKGVYEIIGTNPNFSGQYTQYFLLSTNIYKPDGVTLAGVNEYPVGGGGLGILIWKAQSSNKSEYVIIQDPLSGTGKGCFINKSTTQTVKDNLLNITKEFGSNKV